MRIMGVILYYIILYYIILYYMDNNNTKKSGQNNPNDIHKNKKNKKTNKSENRNKKHNKKTTNSKWNSTKSHEAHCSQPFLIIWRFLAHSPPGRAGKKTLNKVARRISIRTPCVARKLGGGGVNWKIYEKKNI